MHDMIWGIVEYWNPTQEDMLNISKSVELDFIMLPIKRVRSGFMKTAARADV